jgi:hypothetical protein
MFYSILRIVLIIGFIVFIAKLQWIGEVTGFTEILKEKGVLTGNIFGDTVAVILFVFVFPPLLFLALGLLAILYMWIDSEIHYYKSKWAEKRKLKKKAL